MVKSCCDKLGDAVNELFNLIGAITSNVSQTYLTGEAILANNAVVLINGIVYNYDKSTPSHYGLFVGFSIQTKAAGQNVVVVPPHTLLSGFLGLVTGDRYYASTTGAISNVAPAAIAGNIVQQIGIAKSATELEIQDYGPVLYQ